MYRILCVLLTKSFFVCIISGGVPFYAFATVAAFFLPLLLSAIATANFATVVVVAAAAAIVVFAAATIAVGSVIVAPKIASTF